MISNQLTLINKSDDQPIFYSRTWRTTSTPDLAIATDDIHSICRKEVSEQLEGSNQKPVLIHIQRQFQANSTKQPASWNYKKAYWDLFRQEV